MMPRVHASMKFSYRLSVFVLSIALISLVFSHNQVHAQGVTTGSMTGRVTDKSDKKPLIGATVKAVHIPTGTTYGTVTKREGRFSIKGMRVGGPYTVTISYVGYNKSVQEGITVELGDDAEVNAQLTEQKSQTQEVIVVAEKDRLLNSNRNGAGSTITEDEITTAPTINRSLSDVARVNPYANQTSAFGGDDGLQGISIGGQNSRFNNVQIDGAVANDQFGLGQAGTAGSQANANFVSLDAIQELQVNVSPYDIRQSGFTGGLVNAITRSGTNTTKGSAFVFGRNADFVGRSPDVSRRKFADFSDYQFGGRIGGALITNKLFYHVTLESRVRNRPLELGLNDPSALNNFPISKSAIDEISEIARSRYGYDAGSSDQFLSRNNTYNLIARVDWNIDESNKFQIRHNYTNAFQDRNVQRTPRIFSLSSQLNEFRSINNSTVLQLNSTIGSSFSNEARLALTFTNDRRDLMAGNFPQVTVLMGSNESVVLGPERSSQANALDQTQIAFTNDATFYLDDHTLTLGTHNEYNHFNNLFIQDYMGSYTFRDAEAFRNGTPTFYRLSYANLDVTGGNPLPRAKWSMMQTGYYLMDEWRASSKLKITMGLRVDIPIFLSTPYDNPLFNNRFDSLSSVINNLPEDKRSQYPDFPQGLSTSRLPRPQYLVSPRIGFNYDVFGDRSLQLRGGTGMFTGRVAAVWLSNQFSNTGVDIFRVEAGTNTTSQQAGFITGTDGNPLVVNLDPNNPLKPGMGLFGGANQNTSVINVLDPNFKNPQVWRSTLAMDVRIDKGINFTVEGIYGKQYNQVEYRNLNNRPSSGLSFSPVDGRQLYARNPSGAGRTDSNNVRDFLQVIYLTNRSEGDQYSGMVQLSINERNEYIPGLIANFAYTYSRANDFADGTNAVALSNWQSTDAINPNRLSLASSSFDVRNRFNMNLSYRLKWDSFSELNTTTTFGLFFTANSGRPYSFVYAGDLNGDGQTNNDLIYLPKREDLNTKVVVYNTAPNTDLRTPDQIWNSLMSLIESNPILQKYQGQVLPRNSLREPWIYQLDLRIAQMIPFNKTQNIEISLDVQNVLNLLNSDWGLQQFVTGQSFALLGFDGTNTFDSQGRMRINYSAPLRNNRPGIYETDNFFSRWRMQLGMRFNF
jgi:hypothetical protein